MHAAFAILLHDNFPPTPLVSPCLCINAYARKVISKPTPRTHPPSQSISLISPQHRHPNLLRSASPARVSLSPSPYGHIPRPLPHLSANRPKKPTTHFPQSQSADLERADPQKSMQAWLLRLRRQGERWWVMGAGRRRLLFGLDGRCFGVGAWGGVRGWWW